MTSQLAVIAVGGNALILDDTKTTIADQYEAVKQSIVQIVDMIEAGWRVVLTHGNGPQVGFILRRNELAAHEVSQVPLDYAVADTQGAIGYMFQKALTNELQRRGMKNNVVSVVTQTLVSATDEAFQHPSKPIGAFMDEATALQRQKELGWSIMQDSGRGWRRTVPSPKPMAILEEKTISTLLNEGTLVIACGGGGIPVTYDKDKNLVGVEAVVDKDLASTLLAKSLKADLLLIPTGVEKVAINFGKPDQRWLDKLTIEEARKLSEQDQFGAGSMQPKVDAILDFISSVPHGKGLITSAQTIKKALSGQSGTWFSATSGEK